MLLLKGCDVTPEGSTPGGGPRKGILGDPKSPDSVTKHTTLYIRFMHQLFGMPGRGAAQRSGHSWVVAACCGLRPSLSLMLMIGFARRVNKR